MYSQLTVRQHIAQTLPKSHPHEGEQTMHTRLLLIILALAGALFSAGAMAYDNCDSLRYNDRAYQACVNNAYGGNSRMTPSTIPIYGPSEEEQEAERKRLQREADAQREVQRAFDAKRSQDREAKALKEVLETERIYGTPRQREIAYDEARKLYKSAMVLQDLGKDKMAESDLRDAEKRMEKAVIDHPHDYGLIIEALGESLRRQGRYDEAVPVLERALGERKFRFHSSHPELGDVLISLGKTYTALGRYNDAEPLLVRALAIRQKAFGKTSSDAGYVHNSLAILYAKQKRFDDAESNFKDAIALHSQHQGKAHDHTVRSMQALAALYRDAGRDSDADRLDEDIRALSKSPQYTSKAPPPTEEENLTRAINLGNQGMALYAAGKYQEAIAIFRDALKLRQGIANNPSRNKEPLEINYFNLGMSLLSAKEYAEAESMLKQALALRDNEPALKPKLAFFGSAEERLMRNLDALAALHTRQQKHFQAEPYLRRIVELQEKTRGAEHLETLASLKALAENLSAQGSDKEAALHWQRTVALAEKLPAAQNQLPDLREKLLTAYYRSGAFPKEAEALEIQVDWEKPWIRLAQAASAAYKARQYEEAISQGQKALDFAQKHSGASENRVGISQNNLAVYYWATKQYDQAEALYKKSLDTYARVSGADSPSLILPLRELGSLYHLQRRFDEAESIYRRLLLLQEKRHGLEHVDVAQTLSKLARILDRKKQYAEAEPLFTRALAIVDKRGKPDDEEELLLDILPGLARAYRNTGRDEEARRVEQRYEKL